MKQDSESRRSKRRAFVICAALGALTVGVLAIVFRQDLETRYHLYRLRKDVRHVLALIAQPEGTPERRAIRRYIAESLGFHGKLTRVSPPDDAPGAIIPGNLPRATRIDIAAGKVPAADCCTFLSDWTGLAVIMDDDLWETELTVPETIHAADAELVGLLLAAHDGSLAVETLPNERRIVRLRKARGAREPPADAGMPQALIELHPTDIAQGLILMMDFAAWIDTSSGTTISVSPDAQSKPIRVAAPIRGADIFVVRELISASGCVLERVGDNDLRITVKPGEHD